MKNSTFIIIALVFTASVCAQTKFSAPYLPAATTVANLPTAASWPGGEIDVTDGNSATDCTVGGGTTRVHCKSNGTVWAAAGGSGSGTVSSGAAACLSYYPSAGTTLDDINSTVCRLGWDNTAHQLIFYDSSGTATITMDADDGSTQYLGTATESVITDLGADPSAPGSAGQTAFYTKGGRIKSRPNGGAAIDYATGDSSGAATSIASGTAITNPPVNVNSSLGASTGSGLYIPGTSLTAGSLYYQASGGLTAADADSSSSMPAVCIAISTTQCMFSGVYRFGSSQGWTAGNILYASGTAGALTATAPSTSGQQVQRVGVALANDTVLLMPSLDVGGVQ